MAQELEAEPTPEYQAVLNRSSSCGTTNMPGNRPAYRDQNLLRQYADSPGYLFMLGGRAADWEPTSWESLGARRQSSGDWMLGCGAIIPPTAWRGLYTDDSLAPQSTPLVRENKAFSFKSTAWTPQGYEYMGLS